MRIRTGGEQDGKNGGGKPKTDKGNGFRKMFFNSQKIDQKPKNSQNESPSKQTATGSRPRMGAGNPGRKVTKVLEN